MTREKLKSMVNANRWKELGEIFKFEPVFHFAGNNFIDWRCVPPTLLAALRKGNRVSSLFLGTLENMNRVQHRKRICTLMLSAQWEELKLEYNFQPRFVAKTNAAGLTREVMDWTCLPWSVREILKCGGTVKETPYCKDGGIFDPLQKPRRKKIPLVPSSLRVARHTLEERIPIRQRLYDQQEGRCHYCRQFVSPNSRHWTIDHILPIARGGTNAEANLVGACEDCNSNKGLMTADEFFKSDFLGKKIAGLAKA